MPAKLTNSPHPVPPPVVPRKTPPNACPADGPSLQSGLSNLARIVRERQQRLSRLSTALAQPNSASPGMTATQQAAMAKLLLEREAMMRGYLR